MVSVPFLGMLPGLTSGSEVPDLPSGDSGSLPLERAELSAPSSGCSTGRVVSEFRSPYTRVLLPGLPRRFEVSASLPVGSEPSDTSSAVSGTSNLSRVGSSTLPGLGLRFLSAIGVVII